MYLGEIVELAPAAELFSEPKHPYTEALLSAIPIPSTGARRLRTTLEGDPPNPVAPPPGCKFHTRCPHVKDRCGSERPVLREISALHGVACHFAETLSLQGIETAEAPRATAAQARFARYSAARASMDGEAKG
jgi:peptide/nickel transport system ATP-binding protein